MNHHHQQKSLYEFGFEELDRELIARGARKIDIDGLLFNNPAWTPEQSKIMQGIKKLYQSPPPLNKELERFPDNVLVIRLKEMSRGQKKADTDENHNRGIIGEDDRMDFYELEKVARANSMTRKSAPMENYEQLSDISKIEDTKKIKKNTDSVGLVCFKNGLTMEDGFASLKVKPFKEIYNLCKCERFADQLCAAGKACTGFLVKEDVIATAGHFINEKELKDLRFVFGFKMNNETTAVTRVPVENVYNVVELIGKNYDREGVVPDLALLRLDRKVEGQEIAKLSMDEISHGQPIYTLGHPLGLPLKFAAGASVWDIGNEFLFSADLDVFMGNSGSPVFDMNTHEVIGLVVQGSSLDFRCVDGCWISIIYPEPGENTQLSKCTRASVSRELLENV